MSGAGTDQVFPACGRRGAAKPHTCGEEPVDRPRLEIAPGAVHLPAWLSVERQRRLVEECRRWALPPAPMRAARLRNGAVMSVRTVCLGWHWQPYRYSRTADDVDGAPVTACPDWLADLGRQAVADAYQDTTAAAGYEPDAALINYDDDEAPWACTRTRTNAPTPRSSH